MTDNYYAPDIEEDEPTAGFREAVVPVQIIDHRYWQEVILRPDQIDLIARRVVELLHEAFEASPAGEDSSSEDEK